VITSLDSTLYIHQCQAYVNYVLFLFQKLKLTKSKKPYDREKLSRAYQATLSGMSVYRASRQYGVPESTLRDRTRHNVATDCRLGGAMLFTMLEEKNLVDHIVYMARVGYGYTITDCQHIAYDYAVSIGKEVRKEKLSQGWIYAFLGRWNEELKVVKPQRHTLERAQCNQLL